MRDREFMAANHVMTGIVKTLKREGGDKTNHHPPISEGALQKMYSLLYAWCGLKSCCIFIRGVVKGCATSLRRHSSSKKRMTVTGSITPYNEADRTHHVVDYRESLKDTRMYAMPGNELCPVQVIGTSRTLSYVNAPSIAQRRQCRETLQQVATGQVNVSSPSSLAPHHQ